ncbi:MAG TPA: hypothetical protein VIH82_07360 [Acidimicrobiia bacterium]
MNKQMQIAAMVVAALALGGGGFAAGMTVGPTLGKSDAATAANASAVPTGPQGRRQVAGGAGAGALGGQGQQVSGRVISVDDGSLTVETRQPGGDTTRSTIALVGADTRVVRSTEVDIKLSDIKAGDQVLIVGATDQATGTVTANAVVVGVNALQQLFGGGGPGGAGAFPRPSGSPGIRPLPSASARP